MELSKFNEIGRSMVEMLGVLAIIGVLSVGAIAGYSKAMFKYKMNKHTVQLEQVISAGLKYAGKWSNAKISQTNASIAVLDSYLIKLNEIPTEMVKDGKIYDIFGNHIYYYHYPESHKTSIFFLLSNSADINSMDICRNLMEVSKHYADNITYIVAMGGTTEEEVYDKRLAYYGNKDCKADNCLSKITLSEIDEICRHNLDATFSPHFKITYVD